MFIHHIQSKLADPLTGISTPVTKAVTSAEVMKNARLDWRADDVALKTEDGESITTHKLIRRSDTGSHLGVVGSGFEVLQNAEAFAFCDGLVKDGFVEYMSAGQFGDGKRIFIQCKLLGKRGGGAEIVKGDVVESLFLLANGHDGSLAVRPLITPVRVVCRNTFKLALSKKANGKDNFSIKHTKNMQERMELAKELMGWAQTSFDEFVDQAKHTASVKVSTEARLKAFFRETFKIDEGKVLDEDNNVQLKNREERLCELFMTGAGQDNPAVRGTAWAAINAITEYLDHESRTAVRGVDLAKAGPDERDRLSKLKRFESNVLGGNARIKQRAMELALAL